MARGLLTTLEQRRRNDAKSVENVLMVSTPDAKGIRRRPLIVNALSTFPFSCKIFGNVSSAFDQDTLSTRGVTAISQR